MLEARKKSQHALVAKHNCKWARATANKTSNPLGDALPLTTIYNQEPCADWFHNPLFALPTSMWKCPSNGLPCKAKLLHNKSGGATNESGMQWLEWLFSDGGARGPHTGRLFADTSLL